MFTVLLAIGILVALALVFGAILGYANVRFHVEGDPIVDQIDAILPQTQCGQCGHPGCRPYAEAISNGEAINRCPPGGQATVQALADLLDVEAIPLEAAKPKNQLKKWPSSVKMNVSVVLSVFRPALLTRF